MRRYKKNLINGMEVRNPIKEFGMKLAGEVKMVFDLVVNHPVEAFFALSLTVGSVFASPNEADGTASFRKIGVPLIIPGMTTGETIKTTMLVSSPITEANSSVYAFYLKQGDFQLGEICFAVEAEEGIINAGLLIDVSSNKSLSAQTGIDVKVSNNIFTGLTYNFEQLKGIVASLRAEVLNDHITIYGSTPTSNFDPMLGASFNLWDRATVQAATNTVNKVFLKASTDLNTKIGVFTPEMKIILEEGKKPEFNPSVTWTP
ncbi:MAG: hypothetical protein WC356_05845 [Candidatus Micrarchaeia archaeon]|jgi:hypothetical protein